MLVGVNLALDLVEVRLARVPVAGVALQHVSLVRRVRDELERPRAVQDLHLRSVGDGLLVHNREEREVVLHVRPWSREGDVDRQGVRRLDVRDELAGVLELACGGVRAERFDAEANIIGGEGTAVMELEARAELDADSGEIGFHLELFGESEPRTVIRSLDDQRLPDCPTEVEIVRVECVDKCVRRGLA